MSIFTLPLFVPVGPNKTKQVHLVFTVEPVGLEQPRYGDRWRIKASVGFTEFLPEMEFWDRCRFFGQPMRAEREKDMVFYTIGEKEAAYQEALTKAGRDIAMLYEALRVRAEAWNA